MAVEQQRKEWGSQIKVEFIEIFCGRRIQYPGSLDNSFVYGCLFRKPTWELFSTWPDVLIKALQQHFPVLWLSSLKCGKGARMSSWILRRCTLRSFRGEQVKEAQVAHNRQVCTLRDRDACPWWRGIWFVCPSFATSMNKSERSCSRWWLQLLETGFGIFTAQGNFTASFFFIAFSLCLGRNSTKRLSISNRWMLPLN